MKITKQWLIKKDACIEDIHWAQKEKDKNSLIILDKLIKQKKYDWANWLIVRTMKYKQYVAYAIYAAEQVIDIFEKKHPDDKRPRKAIEAAKKCIKNNTKKNRIAAAAAAAAADAYADAVAAFASAAASASASADAAAFASAAASAAAFADAAASADAADAYAVSAAIAAAAAAAYAAAYAEAARNKMKLKILKHGLKISRS